MAVKGIKAKVRPKIVSDLKDLVKSNAEYFGDHAQYYYKYHGEVLKFSYNDMLKHVNRLGTAFSELGLIGETVAVIGDMHPYYLATLYAVVNGNGVIVPLDKDLHDEAIIDFIKRSGAKAIAYTESFNGRLTDLDDKLETVKYYIPFDREGEPSQSDKVIAYSALQKKGKELLDKGSKVYTDIKVDTDKMCALLFTSGTTGTSKGVMLSQRNFTSSTNASSQAMEYDDDTRYVSCLPIHHTYEMVPGEFASTNCGGSLFINDSLRNLLRNFQYFKPTALILVPLFVETMYKRMWHEIAKQGLTRQVRALMKVSDGLLKIGIDQRERFFKKIIDSFGGGLRSIVCGGAPISEKIVRDFYSLGINIMNGYGITECSPLVAVNPPNAIRFGSVGLPVRGCRVKIDRGADGVNGEILVKGDNVMLGYLDDEDATKAAFTDDGWFKTGDLGYLDEDGYLYITGRKKNLIILSNGKNIYPEEIESYLTDGTDLIKECVVIARVNSNNEQIITAVIYPDFDLLEGLDEKEIYDKLKEIVNETNRTLPLYKQVREIEIRDEEFEKTTTRKIKRYKVQ